jgi:hypothetical protein
MKISIENFESIVPNNPTEAENFIYNNEVELTQLGLINEFDEMVEYYKNEWYNDQMINEIRTSFLNRIL